MSERTNPLKASVVLVLGHPIELGHVMNGQVPCRSHCCQVLIESITEVFTPMIRMEHFDCLTMLLCHCPSLKTPVCIEGLCLGVKKVSDCVLSSIICEGDEVLAATLAGDQRWPPHISVDLLPKVLQLRTYARLWNRFLSGTSVEAAVSRCLSGIRVEFDSKDQPLLNEGTCT